MAVPVLFTGVSPALTQVAHSRYRQIPVTEKEKSRFKFLPRRQLVAQP